MSEAVFIFSNACQPKPPSAQINIPVRSNAPSVKHRLLSKKSRSHSRSQSQSDKSSPDSKFKYKSAKSLEPPESPNSKFKTLDSTGSLYSSSKEPQLSAVTSTPLRVERASQDRMFLSSSATPLPDYKHTANQTAKTRAQAQAISQEKVNRKSSSTGSSSRSKYAYPIGESQTTTSARGDAVGRSSSISSNTASSGLTTAATSETPPSDSLLSSPFSLRNGRRHLRDTTLSYPLPCDLAEIHRQTLRTMLLCQVFNGPICSPAFNNKPPKRVLEIGCGTGFWSIMCHRHFSQRGFPGISFTGIDIAPLAQRMESDDDMNWKFVQHDLRRVPLPFREDEFNLVMVKDISMVMPIGSMQQALMDEYLRILKPGGTLEIWDGDHSLRMLLPHAPPPTNPDCEEDDEQLHTNAMGTYTLTAQTPLGTPQNHYLVDYNNWITKALETKKLNPMPCTEIQPLLLQESEDLAEIENRRLAIPLGEVRWEREGVGGTVTQGSNEHAISSKGKLRESDRKMLTAGQAALRRTALLTVVQMIESLEPILREASGKGQDEWDHWQGNMMNDLLKNNGTSWGECLEVGAWWARKKKPSA